MTKNQDRNSSIDWVPALFIGGYHLALAVLAPLYFINQPAHSTSIILGTGLLWACTLISITAGYHRLYAHRTYKTKAPVEWVMLFFGTLAAQSSVIRWAHDHRLHHQHVDKDGDPYGTNKGFWHSHLLWMFRHGPELNDRYIKDLRSRSVLRFQHKYYGILLTVTNVLVFVAMGILTGDWFGAFVIGFLLRTFFVHHCTWFINSLAHMWGSKPYSSEHSAVNNFILSILTYGEGYHNYHHTFAGDYRNGVRWYQFDPPKYLIWLLSKVGLASDLKKTDPMIIKRKLVQADRKLLLDHLASLPSIDASMFTAAVESLADRLSESIASAKTTMDRYRSLDRKNNRVEVEEMKAKFRSLKQQIAQDLRTWKRLCRMILDLQPA